MPSAREGIKKCLPDTNKSEIGNYKPASFTKLATVSIAILEIITFK